ncbi:MAG: hypothetical protein AAF563_13880 [Pseudomonadota bacterium]
MSLRSNLVAPISRLARDGVNVARSWSPSRRAQVREYTTRRRVGLAILHDLSSRDTPDPVFTNVLVDGQWDNANFWTRYAFLRRALGLAKVNEVGVVGEFSRDPVAEAFTAFGIDDVRDFGRHVRHRRRFRRQAEDLLSRTSRPEEILAWQLPNGFPATIVYDGVLKRQRRGVVDLNDPMLVDYVAEALSAVQHADDLLEDCRADLLVTSHAVDFAHTALIWAAVTRGAKVIVLYGDYGSARFIRIDGQDQVFSYPGRPNRGDWESLSPVQYASLAENGMAYLRQRFGGDTGDVGAVYAYQRRSERVSRRDIAAHYGWDPQKPIIAVYASNWFDYPHFTDSMPYRDFVDWMAITIDAATANSDANWLFKAHPCDEWYGKINGVTLADMLADNDQDHIALMETSWTGHDVLEAIDGLVTCHGTAGIEAAAVGTPVLVAYPGWYSDADFAVTCRSPEAYAATLETAWWTASDMAACSRQARAFAGWYFCVPDWQGSYVFPDDANQNAIWRGLPNFLNEHRDAIDKEIAMLREWTVAADPYYHVFKMSRALGYRSPERERGLVEGIAETGAAA